MMDLRDWQGLLLLIAFLPMVVAGVFIVLSFSSMGYGRIGRALIIGFSLLATSLLMAFINMMFIQQPIVQIPVGILRIAGWIGLAYGFIELYREVNRGLF